MESVVEDKVVVGFEFEHLDHGRDGVLDYGGGEEVECFVARNRDRRLLGLH